MTTNKEERCLGKLEESFRSQDLFGEKVKLTYKGKKSYKTNIGACISVLVRGIMAIYIANELYLIIIRKHPEVSVKRMLNDFATNPSSLNLHEWNPIERGFDFGIGILARNDLPSSIEPPSFSGSENTTTDDAGTELQPIEEEDYSYLLSNKWSPIILDPTYGYLRAQLAYQRMVFN
jgi:hypothetical protein